MEIIKPGRLAHIQGPDKPLDLLKFVASELTTHNLDELNWLITFGAVYVNKERETDQNRQGFPSCTTVTSDQTGVPSK